MMRRRRRTTEAKVVLVVAVTEPTSLLYNYQGFQKGGGGLGAFGPRYFSREARRVN